MGDGGREVLTRLIKMRERDAGSYYTSKRTCASVSGSNHLNNTDKITSA